MGQNMFSIYAKYIINVVCNHKFIIKVLSSQVTANMVNYYLSANRVSWRLQIFLTFKKIKFEENSSIKLYRFAIF